MEMLDKKENSRDFLCKFKMGHKPAETTHNINNAFDALLELLMNIQCSGGSRSFAKEMRPFR